MKFPRHLVVPQKYTHKTVKWYHLPEEHWDSSISFAKTIKHTQKY